MTTIEISGEIRNKIQKLQNMDEIYDLIDLLNSIKNEKIISINIFKLIINLNFKNLEILRFIFFYSKNDPHFSKLIEPYIPYIVIEAYQFAADKELIKDSIASWVEAKQWDGKAMVEKCLNAIDLWDSRNEVSDVVKILKDSTTDWEKIHCDDIRQAVNSRIQSLVLSLEKLREE
jgi:hypothetical protein